MLNYLMMTKANHSFCILVLTTILSAGCGYLADSTKESITAYDLIPEHTLTAEVLMHMQLDYIDSEKLVPKLLRQSRLKLLYG